MRRGRIPLTALRSFEAAGRLGSFTLAAQELFVSQAAISRQVRELEELLGRKLFDRLHRRVEITAAGKQLLSILTRSFDEIDSCMTGLQAKQPRLQLTVSAGPAIATFWLVSALSDFRESYPYIDLNLESDHRLTEFRSQGAEIAIRFGEASKNWPRTQRKHLFDVEMVPVISSQLLRSEGTPKNPRDLLAYTLLHEDDYETWKKWFSAVGVSAVEVDHGHIFTDGGLVLQALRSSQGIAIADKILVEEDLKAGTLIQLFDLPLTLGAYWLVARDFSKLSEQGLAFDNWITPRLRKFGQGRSFAANGQI